MAGPRPMSLGPYAFQALGFSFGEQSRDLQTPWAEIEVADRFEALQWVGPKSDSFTIKGCIFEEEFGGTSSLEGLRSAAIRGLPLMLVTLAGGVGGFHVIQSISEDRTMIRSDGLARKNRYEIRLKRYTPSGIAGTILSLF